MDTRAFAVALLAALPAAADLFQVDLFEQGAAGVHTYRIPALAESRRGTLLAAADARFDSTGDLPGRIAIVLRRSFDKGRTWTPAQFIHRVPEGGAGDPSLLVDPRTGRIWCFFAYGPPGIGFPTAKPGARTGVETLQLHAIHSDDDGATWSSAADLTPQVKDPAWRAFFATSGAAIVTRTGRYLLPLVVRDADNSVHARNAYSDDRGATWHTGPSLGPGTDESHHVELRDGAVLQNLRTNPGGPRGVAVSRDGGVSFSPVERHPSLVDPGCNAGITRHARKNALVFTNAASTRRERMTVKVSRDDGRSWSGGRVVHEGPAAYSSVIVLRDGSIGVLYERGEKYAAERITFARFPLSWAEK
ncbi:MAG: exo-alpha-sialidase [Acidobacteria bacterium]|nr:exo-alpha-sialidase [Acidobacteriota bacterium]